MSITIRIATRKSALALWQAEHVAAKLEEIGATVELVPMSTKGDEILDRSLQKIGGKGLFIKELEIAMQQGEADIAVHSMKDVPADLPDGFSIGAVLQRANPFDALVGKPGISFATLPLGARIGSSSLRRQAQLKAQRPDLKVEPLRGNVNTRLAKMEAGTYDAIILAAAGLERLGLDQHIQEIFDRELMLPAAAQGVVGIEYLESRDDLRDFLAQLNDTKAACTTAAERSIAFKLQANCQSPVASYAELDGGSITLTALVAMPDGSRVLKRQITGDAAEPEKLGLTLADTLIADGAMEMLAESA